MPIYALGDITPQIDPTAFVHPDAVVIGNVTIGAESTIWPGAVLRGDGAGIVVGARTSIQDGAIVHNTEVLPTVIGDDCTVGHMAHLEGCTVHNAVLIGTASIAAAGRGTLPTIPVDAILEADGDRASVFVLDGDRARRRAVRLATIRGDRVAVREGLADAGHVVVSGASYLDDGAAVRVLP